jgi:hypothetical protein
MKPTKLMAKDSEGNQVVFEVDGVEWSGMEREILTERDILTELYHKTNGNEWSNKDGWLDKDRGICSWYGVQCKIIDGSRAGDTGVEAILLQDNHLNG